MYTYLELNEFFETKEEALNRANKFIEEKNLIIDEKINAMLVRPTYEISGYYSKKIENSLDGNKLNIETFKEIKNLLLEKKKNSENIKEQIKEITLQ